MFRKYGLLFVWALVLVIVGVGPSSLAWGDNDLDAANHFTYNGTANYNIIGGG